VADLQIGALLILLINLFNSPFVEHGNQTLLPCGNRIRRTVFLHQATPAVFTISSTARNAQSSRGAKGKPQKNWIGLRSIFARKNLRAKIRNHLRHREHFMFQLDARHSLRRFSTC